MAIFFQRMDLWSLNKEKFEILSENNINSIEMKKEKN